MKGNKGLVIAYWVVVAVLVIVGLVGLYWRLTTGHKMANYGELIVWGLWVSMYIFFMAVAAGAFIVASMVYTFDVETLRPVRRLALLTPLVAMPLGFFSIWVDLGHMERAYEMITRPHLTSMMNIELWLYGAFFIVLLVMLWEEFAKGGEDKALMKWAGAIGLVLVILYEAAGGALFGVAKARPAWHGGLFPLLFILSGFTVGVGTVVFLHVFLPKLFGGKVSKPAVVWLGELLLVLIIIEFLFVLSEYFVGLYSGIPSEVTPLKQILTGPFWYVFWIGQFLIGIVLPIVLLAWQRTRTSPLWVAIAGLGVFIGTFAMRLNLVIPALAYPELKGLVEAVPSPRMTTVYVPSTMEWFVGLGIFGLGMAAFAVLYHLLPVQSQAAKEA